MHSDFSHLTLALSHFISGLYHFSPYLCSGLPAGRLDLHTAHLLFFLKRKYDWIVGLSIPLWRLHLHRRWGRGAEQYPYRAIRPHLPPQITARTLSHISWGHWAQGEDREGNQPHVRCPHTKCRGRRRQGSVCSGTLGSSRARRRGLCRQLLYFHDQQSLRESGAVSLWWELSTLSAASLGLCFRRSAGRSQRAGAGLQKIARRRQQSVRPRLRGRAPG